MIGTERTEGRLMTTGKFGARVSLVDENRVNILQTIRRGKARYVIDGKGRQTNAGTFVDLSDDKAIAGAVRAALRGELMRP